MKILERYLDQDRIKSKHRLATDSGISDSMLYQLKKDIRKPNAVHAIKLEIGSEGKISAEEVCPDFFNLLKQIGYQRVNKKNDSKHVEINQLSLFFR